MEQINLNKLLIVYTIITLSVFAIILVDIITDNSKPQQCQQEYYLG